MPFSPDQALNTMKLKLMLCLFFTEPLLCQRSL